MDSPPTRRDRSGSPAARRSFSRSRSRSPRSRKTFRRGYKSRSRSRGGRSHSRSPMSGRRRHAGNRVSPPPYGQNRQPRNDASRSSRLLQEAPGPNKCLGVFGLSLRTNERELRDVFARYGPIEECTVVIDAQTGRSRGFAFIYYESMEDAKAAKESCNGIEIDNRRIRVDFSITQRAHTPTPGIYMGKPTYGNSYNRNNYDGGRYQRRGGGGGGGGGRRDDYRDRGYRGDRGRSPSPYRHRRPRYSRSRSYSPRDRYYDRSRSRSYSPYRHDKRGRY